MIILEFVILLLFPYLLLLIYHYLWFSRIIFPQQYDLKMLAVPPLGIFREWLRFILRKHKSELSQLKVGSFGLSLSVCKNGWRWYWVILAVSTLAYGGVYFLQFQMIWQDLLFLLFVLPLMLFDWRYSLLPNALTLLLLWLGIILAWLGYAPVSLSESIGAVIVGYGVLTFLYYGSYIYYQHEAIGKGDIKFMAALGAWIGLSQLLPFLFVSSMLGIIVFGLVWCYQVWVCRKNERSKRDKALDPMFRESIKRERMMPFGPSLGISGIIFYLIVRVVG